MTEPPRGAKGWGLPGRGGARFGKRGLEEVKRMELEGRRQCAGEEERACQEVGRQKRRGGS